MRHAGKGAAPPALENILEGDIVADGDETILRTSQSVRFRLVAGTVGRARATVDPRSILLSSERIESSARNCLPGEVVALSQCVNDVAVTVDVGVPLTAYITYESYETGRIVLGKQVFLTFKASSVTIF